MATNEFDETIQKTVWTDTLLEDLYAALRNNRDDATVRAFAKELMDDKDLPIGYLVRKAEESCGPRHAERLDVLVRGRHVVEREKKAREQESTGGVKGLLKRFLG